MRQKLLVNDVHLGVARSGGTTPKSAVLLKEWLLTQLHALLMGHTDKDVVINGDLFDAFAVAMLDALGFYIVACEWLDASKVETHVIGQMPDSPKLVLVLGNHDWSKDNSKLSSFAFIARILKAQYGDRVVVVDEPHQLDSVTYIVPHMPNQDLFNMALAAVPAAGVVGGLLLLHANYDNNFAVEADHSLNVSEQQAKELNEAGWTLVFGHEHQARVLRKGGVVIAGNQWPSSVADCLNNPHGVKNAHVITGVVIDKVPTWTAADDFAEVDWQDLANFDGAQRFIRIVGKASAAEAAELISVISKFRQKSEAFVITNAVGVEGMAAMDELPATMESMKAFDVLAYLHEQLEPEQSAVVAKLLAEEQQ